MTSLLTEGLVARGHDVTLFATGASRTAACLHVTFDRGYNEDLSIYPWEMAELMNLAAAVERADSFDIIHVQAEYAPLALPFARLSNTPILQTAHHAPSEDEVRLWSRYPEAPFVAVSNDQARRLAGLNVVGTVHHALRLSDFPFRPTPDDYLLFLGRFTEGKGVLEAIDIARRMSLRLILAAAENDYFREHVRPRVDGTLVVFAGEVGPETRAALLGGARALLYPVQTAESFGLVLAEAASCGTPAAALDCGPVGELVEDGVSGGVFSSVNELVAGLPAVLALDRTGVRAHAESRFGVDRMVDEYVEVYQRVIGQPRKKERRDASTFEGRSILAVFAHPDDESLSCGGLLAACAARGAHVSLVCLTRGDAGPSARADGPAFGTLATRRTHEVRAASAILGIHNVVVLDYEDGMLPWTDAAGLERTIGAEIERVRPDVVVTFGADGLYWHPDHIAVHERTTTAIHALGQEAPSLYYVTLPPGSMRAVFDRAAAHAARLGGEPPRQILGIAEPDAFGAYAAPPTLVVNVMAHAIAKLTALKSHASQLTDDALLWLTDADASLIGIEHFHRAGTRSGFIERLSQ
jgi:LmbE family N-acetylglucosaminyl deacetylase/glycosyltransferase involved in cell wall biosynthesis